MTSPTIALLWEIWRKHRWTVVAIGGLTAVARVVDVLQRRTNAGAGDTSPLVELCGIVAFLLLFAVFNYTESSGARGIGRFPHRLFTLPVSTLRLVTVPTVAGIASIELLYLLWLEPMRGHGSASGLFLGVLFAALIVFYLTALWTLARTGSLRLLVVGVIATATFVVGLLPSFPPTPPPPWRSEIVLGALVAVLAIAAFLMSWQHVARLRAGGSTHARPLESLAVWASRVSTPRRRAFRSAAAAHFWFEWRLSGLVLPALVSGVVLVGVLPMSWMVRSDAGDTMRLLLAALAAPVVLAVPVGIAFSKPTFWSEDLTLHPFVAVRPLTSEELVATKLKVAAASAAIAWMMLLAFVTIWLSSWANLDALSRFAIQLWAFHGQSVAAVYGVAVLVAIAGMFLTWRFLVSRLWSGLIGIRPLFLGSVAFLVILVIASLVFDIGRLPGWLVDDPARLAPVVWMAAVAVIAKYWTAAYAWRGVTPRYLRIYLPIWLAGTAAFLTLGLLVWGIMRIYLPIDVDRLRSAVVLLALLVVPLARVGLAPLSLTRNRHRS